jgi:hypothetical protein
VKKYFGTVLTNFEQGVNLDIRVKLAIQFLTGGAVPKRGAVSVEIIEGTKEEQWVEFTATGRAHYALDMATALMEEADKRGLLEEFDDMSDELAPRVRNAISRAARSNVLTQLSAQRIAQEETAHRVDPAVSMPGGNSGKRQ